MTYEFPTHKGLDSYRMNPNPVASNTVATLAPEVPDVKDKQVVAKILAEISALKDADPKRILSGSATVADRLEYLKALLPEPEEHPTASPNMAPANVPHTNKPHEPQLRHRS